MPVMDGSITKFNVPGELALHVLITVAVILPMGNVAVIGEEGPPKEMVI